MLPDFYACSSCDQRFSFTFREAYYYMGATRLGKQVADADLLWINVRPAWCKDCDCLCLVEDIAPLKIFETAYGLARTGRPVEYPGIAEHMDTPEALREVGEQLRWRMARRLPARALCCGGSRYQWMNVAQPVFKHAECDFGFIEERIHIGGHNGCGPGIVARANIPLYDTEGELLGQLTWRKRDEGMWDIEPLQYPQAADD
ncbi:hypothetical protein [Massilia aquatica]|uniref:Uncharacterized protein n=1 Tax=Massilia aquatica TaxID=2609000 RepID=A0ABX0MDR1_9BURK|nr:hypothetical protein [Massilia aquatica]NHZ43105.1 hypothetical protein [Massilia aquatica]